MVLAAAIASAVLLPAGSSAVAPDPNPWRGKGFLNIAHQGGEDEAPSETLFALKSAINPRGADMLEIDVNLTMDGHLVVMHDDTVNRTTQVTAARGTGDSMVRDLTLAEVQALDAGYTFTSEGTYSKDPSKTYPYRGIRTGAVPPPAGYTPDDFKIPTLREVLDTFPTTPINIEIKMEKHQNSGPPSTGCQGGNPPTGYCDDATQSEDVAHALAAVLNETAYTNRTDIIVVSFSDQLIDVFNADAPDVALAPGIVDTATFALAGIQPDPDVAAFQVPPNQDVFDRIPERLINDRNAHGLGYAVHVWPNDANGDTDAEYERFVKLGVEGYMASRPSRLHAYLCANEIPRPDGTDRCPNEPKKAAKKKCKKKKKAKGRKSAKRKKKKCKKKGKRKK